MFSIWVILLIIGFHFIADFFCQTQKIAERKSKSTAITMLHALIYGTVMMLIAPIIFIKTGRPVWCAYIWVILNAVGHMMVDYLTADIYTHFVTKDKRFKRGFFNTMAVDQMIHISFLLITFQSIGT